MFSRQLFIIAALILVGMGFMHSFLGERYMFRRLFAIRDLPLFRKDRRYTERVLRFAWHITSIAWCGFAALLFLLAAGRTSAFRPAIAITLAIQGVIIVTTCGVRHPAWWLFFLAAATTWFAA